MRGHYRGYRGRTDGGWEGPGRPYDAERPSHEEMEHRRRMESRGNDDYGYGSGVPREREWERGDGNEYGHQAGWDDPDRPRREEYQRHWAGPGPEYRPPEQYRRRDEDYSRRPHYEYPTRPYEQEGPFGRDWEERERRWHEARQAEYGREDRHYREELGWQGSRAPEDRPYRPQRRRPQEPSRWY